MKGFIFLVIAAYALVFADALFMGFAMWPSVVASLVVLGAAAHAVWSLSKTYVYPSAFALWSIALSLVGFAAASLLIMSEWSLQGIGCLFDSTLVFGMLTWLAFLCLKKVHHRPAYVLNQRAPRVHVDTFR